MLKSYDTCSFKMAIPEVVMVGDKCKVKVTVIGKIGQEECQLALLFCRLTSLKRMTYEIELHPDMIRLTSNGRSISEGQLNKPEQGFGLAGASLEVCVLDILKKEKYMVHFKRGSDRKWMLEGLDVEKNVEMDRRILRERRRKVCKIL